MASYANCKFCHGAGCIGCYEEAKKAERRRTKAMKNWSPPAEEDILEAHGMMSQLSDDAPDLKEFRNMVSVPEPLLTVPREDAGKLKDILGGDALQEIFGDGGGGIDELMDRAEKFRVTEVFK